MTETTEKITINLSVVDLGKIDILVEQGFYANRTDFVKDAVRRSLDTHEVTVQEKIKRLAPVGKASPTAKWTGGVGIIMFSRSDLEEAKRKGHVLDISIVGLVHFAANIAPELAEETIRSFRIYGSLRATPEVKEVLLRKMAAQTGGPQ